MNNLQKRIMRRIYFAFLKRVAMHPLTMHAALFTLALYIFGEVVFVKRVIENFMSVEFVDAPAFVFNALLHSEVLTLIAVGVMTFTLLSIPFQIRSQFVPKVQAT